ncbi:hypothetical protein RMATCC62417_07428 [Rhizopus microsporus]|nr:hypothetical protein RMATCC62417_07428 [Rhizopus microsporus]
MDISTTTTTPESLEQQTIQSTSRGNKRNKVRCDGAQPCERCQKAAVDCNFSSVASRKGPPKEYLEPFESRLRAVDAALQRIHKSGQTPPIKLDFTSSVDKDYFNISSIGRGLYVPEYPTRMDRIEPLYQNNSNLSAEPPEPHLKIKPPVPMRFDLIKLYFDHIHHSMPFVSKLSITSPQPPSLLLNAVYAVASKFDDQQQQQQQQQQQHQVGNPPGWPYYKMALSLIDIYMDTPRLSTIQALLLLIKYHEHVQRPGFFWRTKSLMQLAIQMTNDLGLSRKNDGSYTSHHDSEYRNRTFWAVYTYETLMSTEHGFQPHFSPDECTAQYPQCTDEEHNDDYNAVLNFHWLSKVIHVQGFVLQFMRSKYGTDVHPLFDEQKDFSYLEQKLNDLGQSIPQIVSSNNDIYVPFIHLIYHVANILLYRPYALSDCVNSSQYNFYCQSSASFITDITEHILSTKGIDIFYSTIRGVQQIIYCLTAALTVQRSKSTDTYTQPFDLSQYQKTVSALNTLVDKSPVTEIEDVSTAENQVWIDTRKRHELASSSNTSSARSSPLDTSLSCPQSPVSPKIKKRRSRSSLQFPSTPDSASYTSTSANPIVSEPMAHQRSAHSTTNRLSRAQNRLSAPSLSSLYQQHPSYYAPQLQQMFQQPVYPPQHMSYHSQPSSPTAQYLADTSGTVASSSGSIDNYYNTPASSPRRSISRRSSLRKSTSFVGDFTIPVQRPTRTGMARPYASARRHTVTNSMPPDLTEALMASGSTALGNDLYLSTMTTRSNRFSAPPNTLLPYNIPMTAQQQQQQVMMDPLFPMDPVIPNTPNESMMGILMNNENNYSFFPSHQP